jgi:ketosteroid isomerase-like protein
MTARVRIAAFALFLAVSSVAIAQQPPSLPDEIARLDREMFDAFNAGDMDKVNSYFDESLEFFHDKNGLLTFADVKKNSKNMAAANNGLRRDLVPGSLQVYPIPNYGAIEVGQHRFCHIENGKEDCGTFQFVHIWKKSNDGWKITRVISYDH